MKDANDTQIQITPTLPAIKWNFVELKAWALAITDRYTDLKVREEDVTAIKSEMAGLNHLKDSLEAARKEAVRKVSEPIKEFEGQVKEVVKIFTDTRTFLADQVKNFEQRERESKKVAVELIIADALDQNKVPDLDIPVQERWLNKTTPLKTISAEVGNIILVHLRQQAEKAALEQAKKDRAVFLEQYSQELAGMTNVPVLPFANFMGLCALEVALDQAQEQMRKRYAQEAEKAQAPPPQPKTVTTSFTHVPPRTGLPLPEPKTPHKELAIRATYAAHRGAEVRALCDKLKAICIEYHVSVTEKQKVAV